MLVEMVGLRLAEGDSGAQVPLLLEQLMTRLRFAGDHATDALRSFGGAS